MSTMGLMKRVDAKGYILVPRIRVFIIRVLLGVLFAVLLLKFFYPSSGVWTVLIAASLLVLFAYVFEYVRKGGAD